MPFFWLRVDSSLPVYGPPQPHRKQVREVDSLARPAAVREEGEPESRPQPLPGSIEQSYGQGSNAEMLREPAILAEQIMTTPVTTMAPDRTIREAREFIRKNRFHHLPVVTDEGEMMGILSDRDLLDMSEEQNETQVRDHMVTQVLAATLDTEIRDAARQMLEQDIHCLPILDPNRKLLGILTSTDVLRCVVNRAPLDLWV